MRKGQENGGRIEEKNALVQIEKQSHFLLEVKYLCTGKTCKQLEAFLVFFPCSPTKAIMWSPVYEMDSW